jgi:hypothetical protein
MSNDILAPVPWLTKLWFVSKRIPELNNLGNSTSTRALTALMPDNVIHRGKQGIKICKNQGGFVNLG